MLTDPSHALALVDLLPHGCLLAVELAEEVECNDSVDVDHNTCHQNRHDELCKREADAYMAVSQFVSLQPA